MTWCEANDIADVVESSRIITWLDWKVYESIGAHAIMPPHNPRVNGELGRVWGCTNQLAYSG